MYCVAPSKKLHDFPIRESEVGIDEQLRLLQAQATPPSTRVVTAIMVTSRGSDAGSSTSGDGATSGDGVTVSRGGFEDDNDAALTAAAAATAASRVPIDAATLEELIQQQRREEEERRERRESINSEDGAFLAEHMFFADSIKRLKEVGEKERNGGEEGTDHTYFNTHTHTDTMKQFAFLEWLVLGSIELG